MDRKKALGRTSFRGTMPIPVYAPEAEEHSIPVTLTSSLINLVEDENGSIENNFQTQPSSLAVVSADDSLENAGNNPTTQLISRHFSEPHSPFDRKSRLIGIVVAVIATFGLSLLDNYVLNRQPQNPSLANQQNQTPDKLKNTTLENATFTVNGKLKVTGEAEVGSLKVEKDMAVTGNGTFGGIVTAAQLNGNGLDITGNGNFSGTLSASTITGNFIGTYSGNGFNLENVDAAFLNGQVGSFYRNADNFNAGTVADGRLSANVGLHDADNIFTGTNNFQAVLLQGLLTGVNANFSGTLSAFDIQQNGNMVCDTSNNCGFASSGSYFTQGGNSFGTAAMLGTTSDHDLNLITNNVTRINVQNDGDVAFNTDTLFVDVANGRVGIGTTTPAENLVIASNTDSDFDLMTVNSNNSSSFHFQRAYGAMGSLLIPNGSTGNCCEIGKISAQEWNGTAFKDIGTISFYQDGTPTATSTPGRIDFYTTPVGSLSAQKRVTINSSGNLIVGNVTPTGTLHVKSLSASTVGAVVQGSSSQTANLQEWQDSTGAILGRINPAGQLLSQGLFARANLGAILSVSNSNPSDVVSIIRGATSQTADLQQWQSSDGSVLASLGASGDLTLSASGASASSPRTISFSNVTSGTRTRVDLTGGFDGLQTGNGQRLQVYSWHGIDLMGGRTATAPSFISGDGTTQNQVRVLSQKSGTVVLGIQATSTQTADLLQFQNSSGTALAAIDPTGSLRFVTAQSLLAPIDSGAAFKGISMGTNVTPANAQIDTSRPSWSFNLQHGTNSTNGDAFVVNRTAAGQNPSSNFVNLFWIRGASGVPTHLLQPVANDRTVVAIKGAASQTGDLQQWQDSTGATMLSVNSSGQLLGTTTNPVTIRADSSLTGSYNLVNFLNASGTNVMSARSFTTAGGDVNNGVGLQISTRVIIQSTNSDILLSAGTTAKFNFINSGTNKGLLSVSGSGSRLILQSDSAGQDVTTGIDVQMGIGRGNTTPTGALDVTWTTTSRVGVLVKAPASQSVDLQQWQDSTGVVLSRVNSTGSWQGSSSSVNNVFGSNAGISGNTLAVYANSATNVPLIVKGFASQTGDLTQWKDSANNDLVTLSSSGALNMTNGGSVITIRRTTGANDVLRAGQVGDSGSFHRFSLAGTGQMNWGTGAAAADTTLARTGAGQLTLQGVNAATGTTLITKGVASQTVNLQEWQDSSGSGLAYIDPSGKMGIGTSGSLSYKLQVAGAMATTSEGDIFAQYDGSSSQFYPVFARYWDTSATAFDGGTYLFANGANGYIGFEKPGGGSIDRLQVKALRSIFYGHLESGNSSGGTTTVAAGAGAGSGAAASVSGNDTAGTVTITTGDSGTATGTLATVTFANNYGAAPVVVLTPNDANAATLQYYYNSATGTFDILSGTTPATATTYKYSYHIIQ